MVLYGQGADGTGVCGAHPSTCSGWRNGRGGIGILAVEGLILGTVATAVAIVLGYGMLLWMIRELIPASYPDMGVVLAIDLPQMAAILAAGIAVVALAPALTVRKLRRMDIPGMLRVLE